MAKKAPRGSRRRRELIPVHAPARQLVKASPLKEAEDAYLAENTRRSYVRAWLDFFEVDDISKVSNERAIATTTAEVIAFRDRLLAMKLKPGTISLKLSAIRAFFDRLILKGSIQVNPAHPKLVRAPKRGTVKQMEYLDPTEIRTFLNAIDRSTALGRRDYALIMTDLHLGLRRSEALKIKVEQIRRMEGKAVILLRSKGEKERIVWVNQDLERALADYADDRGKAPGPLFPGRYGGSLSGDQFWRIVQKYLRKAGIQKRVGTHGLRSSFIMRSLDQNVPLPDIQRTVGHSRPETTLGYARDREMIKSKAPKAMEGLSADD